MMSQIKVGDTVMFISGEMFGSPEYKKYIIGKIGTIESIIGAECCIKICHEIHKKLFGIRYPTNNNIIWSNLRCLTKIE